MYQVHGLILVGGKSQRMGVDKYGLKVNGVSLIDRAVEMLLPYVDKVYISKRRDQILPDQQVGVILDLYEHIGPMAGIWSAMDHNPLVSWLVYAVDLPKIQSRTIQELCDQYSLNFDVIVPYTGNANLQPTMALYNPSFSSVLNSAIIDQKYGLRRAIAKAHSKAYKTKYVEDFFNLNNPEDLEVLQR